MRIKRAPLYQPHCLTLYNILILFFTQKLCEYFIRGTKKRENLIKKITFQKCGNQQEISRETSASTTTVVPKPNMSSQLSDSALSRGLNKPVTNTQKDQRVVILSEPNDGKQQDERIVVVSDTNESKADKVDCTTVPFAHGDKPGKESDNSGNQGTKERIVIKFNDSARSKFPPPCKESLDNELTDTREKSDDEKEEGEITDTEDEEPSITTSETTKSADSSHVAVAIGSSCTDQEKNNTSSTKQSPSDRKSVLREEEIKKSQNVGVCGTQVSETSGQTKSTTTLSNKNDTMEKADSRSNSRSGSHCEEAELLESPESPTPEIQDKFSFPTTSTTALTDLLIKLAPHSNPLPPVTVQAYPVTQQAFTASRTNATQSHNSSGHTRQTIPLVQPVPQPVLSNGTPGIPAAVHRMPQRVSRFDVVATQPIHVTRPTISNVAVVQPMHSQVPALLTGPGVVQPMPPNVGVRQSSPSIPGPINLQLMMGNVPMRQPVQSNVIPTQPMPPSSTVIVGQPMAAVAQTVSTVTGITEPNGRVSFASTAPVNKSSTPPKPLNTTEADSAKSRGNNKQVQPGCPMSKKILEYCHDVAHKPQSAENNANVGNNSMQSTSNDAPSRPADNRSLSGTALEPQLSRNQQYKISAEDPQLSQHYVEWVQLLIDDNRVSQ